MQRMLCKHGDDYALVIDSAILELLKISPDTPLELTVFNGSLIVSPIRDETEQDQLNEALTILNQRFGRAMKKLAE